MIDSTPIRHLKPLDQATPLDPQSVGVDLLAQLRALRRDVLYLRDLVNSMPGIPPGVRAQLIDLFPAAATAEDTAEDLLRAYRAAGLFSATYSGVAADLGV